MAAYRREREINVRVEGLSPAWRRAVCAAESLSLTTKQGKYAFAKRLRLTLGNGYGITEVLDKTHHPNEMEDKAQEEFDASQATSKEETISDDDLKREARAEWWLDVIKEPFTSGGDILFDHPAILAAIETIEEATGQGEKVLVFGRFIVSVSERPRF